MEESPNVFIVNIPFFLKLSLLIPKRTVRVMYKSFQILNPFKAKKTWSEKGVENVSRYGGDSKKQLGVVYEKMGVRMHPPKTV